jgi:hypothetical protein
LDCFASRSTLWISLLRTILSGIESIALGRRQIYDFHNLGTLGNISENKMPLGFVFDDLLREQRVTGSIQVAGANIFLSFGRSSVLVTQFVARSG